MIAALRTSDDTRWYRLALGALALGAWAALIAWGASPYAGLLSHRELAESGGLTPLRLIAFTAGWLLMTIAMMLPSSLPLVNLFGRFVARRYDRSTLTLSLVLGYLAVWAAFGILAFLGDAAIHRVIERSPDVADLSQWIGVGVLLIAGVYQVTPLKNMCLVKCRSPYLFLAEHWRGRQAIWEAIGLGARHGLFCVGCCWTLMLLMFAIGGVNLGWMLTLASLMTAEKSSGWGQRLTVPVGLLLLLLAVGLVYRLPLVSAMFGG
jgi:predicted metal-binding membrane protein